MRRPRNIVAVDKLSVSSYRIPTDFPESDGTLAWDATTLVLVQAEAAGARGIGYTYADRATATLIHHTLAEVVRGADAMSPPAAYMSMWRRIRNLGRPGICSMAISAVDCALWDLKARLLNVPLIALLGEVHSGVPVYGSGGFTSYSISQLQRQLSGWVKHGIVRVKMKVGRQPEHDGERVHAARKAIGGQAELYVDANGAYTRKQALAMAEGFAEENVSWFEEPVSSDDLLGLRLLRDRAPAGMAIAAGEYGYDAMYFRRMLAAGAVDVLQADATRCGGVTGFMQAAALAQAWCVPLSAHTAPSLHAHLCCAIPNAHSIEYFHDHVRIESMFFDGFQSPIDGKLAPDRTRSGLGLELKRADLLRFAA